MKKKMSIGIALFTAAAAVLLFVLAGKPFLEMAGGAAPAGDSLELAQMEGQYIVYSVAHPIASYAEEFYSGNQDRVSKMAYITYDEGRRAFVKIVIPERKKSDFERLMRASNRSEELKEQFGEDQKKDEAPIDVTGSLMPMEASEVQMIQEALLDAYTEGSSMEEGAGGELLDLALAQTEWYMIEEGYVQGIPALNLWFCAAVIGLNVLFLLVSLISLLKKGKTSVSSGKGDSVDKMLDLQRAWLEPWCIKGSARRRKLGFLWVLGGTVAVSALGFLVGTPVMGVLTLHLPIGLGIGELCGLPMMLGSKLAFNPDKLIKLYRKNLEKEMPAEADREALAEDIIRVHSSGMESGWSVLETGKEELRYGILGERYWLIFAQGGLLQAVDSQRAAKMETEMVEGQIQSGRVRINYVHYDVRIKYKDSEQKKKWDVFFNFQWEDTTGRFMLLARKRLGERADEVISAGQ